MSYRGRRGGRGGPNQSLNNIGQRRSLNQNFVPQSSTPQKPAPSTPQQPTMTFRNQQPQTPQQPVKQEVPISPAPPAPTINPTPPAPTINPQPVQKPNVPANGLDITEPIPAKVFWASRKGIKISKQEQQRRRNIRLGRILQPKNAVMIINELVQNPQFNVSEVPLPQENNQYRATVVLDNIEHVGLGRNKNQAKNAAAETAIRYLIRKRKVGQPTKTEDGQESQMEVDATDSDSPIPWQHVASLALHKLFNSWGEEPKDDVKELKPAKKLPDNPETIQPIMLLNQMLPNTQYQEISRTGQPPNIMFTYKCIANGEEFIGTGPKAKLAKRMAAYAACHKIFNINYPPEVWSAI